MEVEGKLFARAMKFNFNIFNPKTCFQSHQGVYKILEQWRSWGFGEKVENIGKIVAEKKS